MVEMSSEWKLGWRVVAGAALGLSTSFALTQFVSSLFIRELSVAFSWSRGDVSSAYGLGLAGALFAPLLGRVVDRVGVRPMLLVCTLVVATGYTLLANMSGELWMLALLIFVTAVFGIAGGAVTYTRAINAWFVKSRGLALGITTSGLTVGGIIAPPILAALMAAYGWRAGYYALAAAAILTLPVVLALVSEPRDREVKGATLVKQPLVGMVWKDVLVSKTYWLLATFVVVVTCAQAGIISQLAPMLGDRGIGDLQIGWLLALLGISAFVGRVSCGFLLDRFNPMLVAAAANAVPIIGCVLLMIAGLPWPAIAVAVAAIGFQAGAELDVVAYFAARSFGMRIYSSIFGSLIALMTLAAASGYALFGKIYDLSGGYGPALAAAAIAYPVAAACFLLIDAPDRQPELAPAS